MFDPDINEAAEALLQVCQRRKLTVATAESCTGGLVAAAISAISGSSSVLDRGYVTYSNLAKQQMLGISAATLDAFGAVSKECAEEMAKGALLQGGVDLAVSITGIAGPTGATSSKPVGLVYFGAASRPGHVVTVERRFGDVGRAQVRRVSVLQAIALLRDLAEQT
jgi:nicotinamide-nucleotide amidase